MSDNLSPDWPLPRVDLADSTRARKYGNRPFTGSEAHERMTFAVRTALLW